MNIGIGSSSQAAPASSNGAAPAPEETEERSSRDCRQLLWDEYSAMQDLFKFYLDMALKANLWFYGLTATVVCFYLREAGTAEVGFHWVLCLPILFSFGFSLIFIIRCSAK